MNHQNANTHVHQQQHELLNEEYDTGSKGNSRVFYIGTSSSNIDVKSRIAWNQPKDPRHPELPAAQFQTDIIQKPVKFVDGSYADLSTLKLSSTAFMSSTLHYALQYAIKADSEGESKKGVLVAVELPPGLRFFDVEDPDDYAALGLSPQLASIFKSMEVFWLSRNIENAKLKLRPDGYVRAFDIVKSYLNANGKPFVVQLADADMTVKQMYEDFKRNFQDPNNYLKKFVEPAFIKMFTQKGWTGNDNALKKKYESTKYNSRLELMAEVQKDMRMLGRQDYARVKRTYRSTSHVQVDPEVVRAKQRGMFAANRRDGRDGINSLTVTPFTMYPASVADNTLFQNYQLLFDLHRTRWQMVNLQSPEFQKIDPYVELLDVLQAQLRADGRLLLKDPDLNYVIQRLRKRERHVYIDTIIWVFLHLLMSRNLVNGSANPFVGIKTSEKVGFLAINNYAGQAQIKEARAQKNDRVWYGYDAARELHPGFLKNDDKTLMVCKPLDLSKCKMFAHTLDFTHIMPSEAFRSFMDGVQTADFRSIAGYEKFFTEQIEKRLFKYVRQHGSAQEYVAQELQRDAATQRDLRAGRISRKEEKAKRREREDAKRKEEEAQAHAKSRAHMKIQLANSRTFADYEVLLSLSNTLDVASAKCVLRRDSAEADMIRLIAGRVKLGLPDNVEQINKLTNALIQLDSTGEYRTAGAIGKLKPRQDLEDIIRSEVEMSLDMTRPSYSHDPTLKSSISKASPEFTQIADAIRKKYYDADMYAFVARALKNCCPSNSPLDTEAAIQKCAHSIIALIRYRPYIQQNLKFYQPSEKYAVVYKHRRSDTMVHSLKNPKDKTQLVIFCRDDWIRSSPFDPANEYVLKNAVFMYNPGLQQRIYDIQVQAVPLQRLKGIDAYHKFIYQASAPNTDT